MTDGARNAMLGYLYQFSLVASLRAYSIDDLPAGSGWRTLVGQLAGGQLTSELFGQDAMASVPAAGREEWVAVQVKYSGDASKAIDLQFFVELLYRFERSARLAADEHRDVRRFYVLTNLRPDTTVSPIWERRSGGELKRALTGRKKNNRWPEWVSRLLKNYPGEEEAFAAWSLVLARLEPALNAPYEHGFTGLESFARRHGLSDEEFERGLQNLAGRLMFDAAGGRSVEIGERWLKEHLVGSPDVRDVAFDSPDGMLVAARSRLMQQLCEVTDTAEHHLTRRRYFDRLRSEVDRHTVTFVCGGGGSGKSVLAVQHLLAGTGGPLGVSVRAADAYPDWLPDLLRQLRIASPTGALPVESLDRSIDRLKTANPGREVVLAVNLDAVDEADPGLLGGLRRFIRLFVDHGHPTWRGKLLLSCRPRQYKFRGLPALIREWVGIEHPCRFADRFGLVEVGDFDPEELEEAERLLGDPPDERIARTAAFATLWDTESLGGTLDGVAPDPALVDALRHPVVWGAYVGLTPDARLAVRQGRPDGTDRLAAAFVERFLRKCVARRGVPIQEHHMGDSLKRVAAATAGKPPPFPVQGVWQTECRRGLNDDETAFLFGEALTYGLIVEDPQSCWRWRHDFVARFLARGGA